MDCICHDGTNFWMVDNYNNKGEYSTTNSPLQWGRDIQNPILLLKESSCQICISIYLANYMLQGKKYLGEDILKRYYSQPPLKYGLLF